MSETRYTPRKGILVTGSAGFIGSTFLPIVRARFPDVPLYALDALTYAGLESNLRELKQKLAGENAHISFHQIDITDSTALAEFFERHEIGTVINFAAETHVDRSLSRPDVFFHTNLIGAVCLLKCAREAGVSRFIQISTDEVYGSTPEGEEFDETAPLNPSSPYAASKAAADLAVLSYVNSYDFPALIIRGCNNYGPRQYPEKLIPFFVCRALEGKPLPLYGDGLHERDWIHARDFSAAVALSLECGADGEIYNVSGANRKTNVEITQRLIELTGAAGIDIEYVADRPGHDRRYRINCEKISALGFSPRVDFRSGLKETVDWYVEHRERLKLLPEWERPLSGPN